VRGAGSNPRPYRDPQNYFPLFTQDLCQHARVACGARRFQNGNGITRLKAPSTSSLDAPSVLISVRVSIKPSWSPLHCSRSTSRDFVPWRFSDACCRSSWLPLSCRRQRNLHRSRHMQRTKVCTRVAALQCVLRWRAAISTLRQGTQHNQGSPTPLVSTAGPMDGRNDGVHRALTTEM
jgi:hypothetical protein